MKACSGEQQQTSNVGYIHMQNTYMSSCSFIRQQTSKCPPKWISIKSFEAKYKIPINYVQNPDIDLSAKYIHECSRANVITYFRRHGCLCNLYTACCRQLHLGLVYKLVPYFGEIPSPQLFQYAYSTHQIYFRVFTYIQNVFYILELPFLQ